VAKKLTIIVKTKLKDKEREKRAFSKECVEALVKSRNAVPELELPPHDSGNLIGIDFEADNEYS